MPDAARITSMTKNRTTITATAPQSSFPDLMVSITLFLPLHGFPFGADRLSPVPAVSTARRSLGSRVSRGGQARYHASPRPIRPMTFRTTIGSSQRQRGATITETLNRRIAIGARRRHKPWFPLAVGMTLLVIGALAWLVIAGPPPAALAMTHTADDRWLVDDVPRGGVSWRAGVRPGMEVLGVSPDGALPDGDWSALLVSDGVVQITVQRKELPPGPEPLIASIAGLVMAIGLSPFLARQ